MKKMFQKIQTNEQTTGHLLHNIISRCGTGKDSNITGSYHTKTGKLEQKSSDSINQMR